METASPTATTTPNLSPMRVVAGGTYYYAPTNRGFIGGIFFKYFRRILLNIYSEAS
jgi:hypothetical protein